jgi:hypothetical protein
LTQTFDAYLDNVVVSGLVRGDLQPPGEQEAPEQLLALHERGEIALTTSHVTKEELSALPESLRRDKDEMSRRVLELPGA